MIYNFISKKLSGISILGPNKSLFYKINNEFKYNLAIRYNDEEYSKLHPLLKYINDYFAESFSKEKITITIDNSALDFMWFHVKINLIDSINQLVEIALQVDFICLEIR